MPESIKGHPTPDLEQDLVRIHRPAPPDPEFLQNLEERVHARAAALAHAKAKPQPQRGRVAFPANRVAAWAAACLLLVFAITWGIENLLPKPLPVAVPLPPGMQASLLFARQDDLWLLDLDGEAAPGRITEDGALNWHMDGQGEAFTMAAWYRPAQVSPDGRWVAFSSTGRDLYLLKLEAGTLQEVPGIGAARFDWSPDSRTLALIPDYVSEYRELILYRLETGESEVLLRYESEVKGILARDVVWSPDGQKIAFEVARGDFVQVQTFDVTSRQVEVISDLASKERAALAQTAGMRLCWTADGQVTVAGKQAVRCSLAEEITSQMAISPDGAFQATLSPGQSEDGSWQGPSRITVADPKSGAVVWEQTFDESFKSVVWSPDGRWLFLDDAGGDSPIWRMPSDGNAAPEVWLEDAYLISAFTHLKAPEPAPTISPIPRSMKGYELYSWQAGGEWFFTLITGTNRNKTLEEIISKENSQTGDWVKLTVQGVEALKSILAQFPAGETILWIGSPGFNPAAGGEIHIELPSQDVVADLQEHCRQLDLDLQVTGQSITTPVDPAEQLTLDSPHEMIRQRIINPDWQTLWVQGQDLATSPDGSPQITYVQAWLDRGGAGRLLSTDQIGGNPSFDLEIDPRWIWVSEGQALHKFDVQSRQLDPDVSSQGRVIHPLESASPVLEMLFPSYLSLRSEDVQLIELSEQAGRPALVIDWAHFRLWVDAQTGVLLRQQTRGADGQVSEDTFLTAVVYDLPLPDGVLSTENLEQVRFEPVPVEAGLSGTPASLLDLFPLHPGTSWTYTYTGYSQSPADPNVILHGTLDLLERVVGVEETPEFTLVHMRGLKELVTADPGWLENESIALGEFEFDYVLSGESIYRSQVRLDAENIALDQLVEDFQFPMSVGAEWCPNKQGKGDTTPTSEPLAPCEFAGLRIIEAVGSYQTPAGSFERCYQMRDLYNSGGVIQWFCEGVGVVAKKYDHAGSRFGFTQELTSFNLVTAQTTVQPTQRDVPLALPAGLTVEEYALKDRPGIEPLRFSPRQGWQEGILAVHQRTRSAAISINTFFEDGHASMRVQLGEDELVASETYAADGKDGWVTVRRNGEEIYRISIGPGSPIPALRGLWAYDDHWVLETARIEQRQEGDTAFSDALGQISVDGVSLNEQFGYTESFGFQSIAGQPFYFFKRDGKISFSFDGQVIEAGYDEIPHYGCCSAAELNPVPATSMVAFFAQREGIWYYVEIGDYAE